VTSVGVVGGGQLAQMLHQAAIGLGVRVVVLDPDPECSAALAGAARVDGTWTSRHDLLAFARSGVDVVTFDHELADPDDLAALQHEAPVPVRPAASTKLFAQDKLHQRAALSRDGVPVPAFRAVATADDVEAFGAQHGWPVVVKTARGGYDGRGVWMCDDLDAARVVVEEVGGGLLVEERVDLDHELAVMVARRPSGQARAWPALRTTQVGGICTEVLLGAGGETPHAAAAAALALDLAGRIGLEGVMAVELFAAGDGRLLVNELACRPHNSGHVTMDACTTGQFEQHLRAVLDLPLGDPAPVTGAAVMVNVLGGPQPWDHAGLADALGVDGATVHLYGKRHRPGRKLGHVNAVAGMVDEARRRALRAAEALGTPAGAASGP
jgi:5-(carboxyamino)imidazole ribonucleotide synthase